MKKRVIKAYQAGLFEARPCYIPQYKRGLFSALLHWEFGWNCFHTLGKNEKDARIKSFESLEEAVRFSEKHPDNLYEIVYPQQENE